MMFVTIWIQCGFIRRNIITKNACNAMISGRASPSPGAGAPRTFGDERGRGSVDHVLVKPRPVRAAPAAMHPPYLEVFAHFSVPEGMNCRL